MISKKLHRDKKAAGCYHDWGTLMNYDLRSLARMGCGGILFLLGTTGWILPIIPGVPLIFLGLGLIFGKARVRAMRILLRRWWHAQWGK
ncbi:hypothetical protein FJ365_03655 [Candidatus Dependentiae bacterium]|nr:hypothetical protein [Candidatus Dependentiae bacterium]